MDHQQIYSLIRGCCISDASAEEAARRIIEEPVEPTDPDFPPEVYVLAYQDLGSEYYLCRYTEDIPSPRTYGVYKLDEVRRMYNTSTLVRKTHDR